MWFFCFSIIPRSSFHFLQNDLTHFREAVFSLLYYLSSNPNYADGLGEQF